MLLQMPLFHSFLWLNNIPLYICTTSYPFTGQWTLDCFHVLAIVNSAVVNLGCIYHFKLEFSLDKCPGMGLLAHMAALFLVAEETSILFSIVAAPVYILTNM